jgi:hypothetical protein
VLYLLRLLEELEVSQVRRAVDQLHAELAAGPGPSLIRLPDVVVLVVARVVGEAASSSRHGLLNHIYRIARVAGDLLRSGGARRKDIQTLVAREAELHWDGLSRLDTVQDLRVIHGAEEARPVVVHVVGDTRGARVASLVGRTTAGGRDGAQGAAAQRLEGSVRVHTGESIRSGAARRRHGTEGVSSTVANASDVNVRIRLVDVDSTHGIASAVAGVVSGATRDALIGAIARQGNVGRARSHPRQRISAVEAYRDIRVVPAGAIGGRRCRTVDRRVGLVDLDRTEVRGRRGVAGLVDAGAVEARRRPARAREGPELVRPGPSSISWVS